MSRILRWVFHSRDLLNQSREVVGLTNDDQMVFLETTHQTEGGESKIVSLPVPVAEVAKILIYGDGNPRVAWTCGRGSS